MSAAQTFYHDPRQPFEAASNAALVTPSDSQTLANVTRGISFATAGALTVTLLGGQTLTIPSGALAAGVIHPIEVTQVWATGTASGMGIVAWW